MATRMQQRRGTAADWAAANPVLSDGEVGFERDTGVIKVGDGVTAWNALPSPFMFKSIIDAKGDLIVGSTDNVPVRLARGTTGQRLTVQADGSLAWESPVPSIPISLADAIGDLIVGSGPDAFTRLPRGTTGQRLTVNADGTLGWTNMQDLSGYETSAHAAATFETQAHAASTYETQAAAAAFETAAHAAATFATKTDARRLMAMASVTNTGVVNNSGTMQDVTGLSVSVNEGPASVQPFALTVNVLAGHRYDIDAMMTVHNGTAGDVSLVQLRQSGTSAGTWLGTTGSLPVGGHSVERYFPVDWWERYVCTTSGTLILTAQIMKTVGTGTNNMGGGMIRVFEAGTTAPNGS